MELVKLDRRWNAHREHGFTHALLSSDYSETRRLTDFLQTHYGSNYKKDPSWDHRFRQSKSKETRGEWRTVVSLKNESIVSHLLLAGVIHLTNNKDK